jgi:hypothetical protein
LGAGILASIRAKEGVVLTMGGAEEEEEEEEEEEAEDEEEKEERIGASDEEEEATGKGGEGVGVEEVVRVEGTVLVGEGSLEKEAGGESMTETLVTS